MKNVTLLVALVSIKSLCNTIGGTRHIVNTVLWEYVVQQFSITDRTSNKDIVPIILDRLQILQIASVGQLVQVYYGAIRVLPQEVLDEIGADKSGSACDQ